MTLPQPTAQFTIPSLYDDLELDCRLYYPPTSPASSPKDTTTTTPNCLNGLAVFAHPYASLGGTYDDHVVALAGTQLLAHNFLLLTFNFRGAEGSHGKTSWTGKGELGDYASAMAFLLAFLNAPNIAQHFASHARSDPPRPRPLLVLGGYSYGSLIASLAPSPQLLHAILSNRKASTAESEIWARAHDLSRSFLGWAETHLHPHPSTHRSTIDTRSDAHSPAASPTRITAGGYTSADVASRAHHSRHSLDAAAEKVHLRHSLSKVREKMKGGSRQNSDEHTTTTADERLSEDMSARDYEASEFVLPHTATLLVSPILGFAAAALLLSASGPTFGRLHHPLPSVSAAGAAGTTIAVFGGRDQYVSARKRSEWIQNARKDGSRVTARVVDGAGHLWGTREERAELRRCLGEWLGQESGAWGLEDRLTKE